SPRWWRRWVGACSSAPPPTAVSTPSTAEPALALRRARLDDVARGVGYEFEGATGAWRADSLDQVRDVLAAAESAAVDGSWVVGFVGYEAAQAFDAAFPPLAGPEGLPLAWFTAFEHRREVPLVSPPEVAPTVRDVHRVDGSDRYRDGVEQVRAAIARGDVYQANLTDRVRGTLDGDPFDLYCSMVSTQGGSFNAYLDLGELVVVSASPELFLQIDGDIVTTRPMKGTRRRHGRPEADAEAADALRHSHHPAEDRDSARGRRADGL
ncbi:MAG: chorismate-binding protein, partial [Actinomycetota bacterium]|nr:chorismate-binding protein [Actinomycetota bacterium]